MEQLPSEQGFAAARGRLAGGDAAPRGSADKAIAEAHARLRATFRTGRTATLEWRRAQLQGIRRMLDENDEAVCEAVMADLGRPKMEAMLCEVTPVIQEVDHILQHLESWMKPEAVATPLLQQPGRSVIVREPKGVVLDLAPWNFPVNLSLMSLASIVAAGNCCMLKPSEIAPRSEAVLARLVPQYLDPEAVMVVTGGVAEATALLSLRWDHIFFTGNGAIARIVMEAAAKHLTPCTLELGGKSPTIVLPGANLAVAARRILSGKLINAGQICIAPDYALVHKDIEAALVQELQRVIRSWHTTETASSKHFGRIINEQHWDRVNGLLQSCGGEVIADGAPNRESKFIPPTLVRGPALDSALMTEEIFGPVLPVLRMDSLDAIVEQVNKGEKPLALYIFGSEADADEIIRRTSSGGVCVNDTIFQVANPDLPFGGIGGSGMGQYHGKFGFDEMSNLRGVMYRKTWVDPAMRYPPYTDANLRLFRRVMVGPLLPPGLKKAIVGAGAAAAGAAAFALRSRL